AGRVGGSRRWAAAFVGLNPVLLELALGGAHNDTLVLLALSAALAFSAGAHPRFRAAACALVAGLGVKVTAGLALPFLLLAPISRAAWEDRDAGRRPSWGSIRCCSSSPSVARTTTRWSCWR